MPKRQKPEGEVNPELGEFQKPEKEIKLKPVKGLEQKREKAEKPAKASKASKASKARRVRTRSVQPRLRT